MNEKKNKSVSLDKTFCECERGNIWVTQTEEGYHAAYFHLRNLPDGKMLLLEMSIVPENYPGFNVNVVEITPEDLAKHINERCDDWYVRKLNLVPEGSVVVEGGYIVAEEE